MKKTPLLDWHASHGANMMEFRGWEMPLWYPSGAVTEHRSVIGDVGIFDTSHMSLITIAGPDAFDLLQQCFTRDLTACVGEGSAPLKPGRCLFGAYLNEDGGVLDDSILCQSGPESYMTVVNAGMGEVVSAHLTSHAQGRDVETVDLTGQLGKIDLQGRNSGKVLQRVLKEPDDVLHDLRPFAFRGHFDERSGRADTILSNGTRILLCRTGYTGEFGFEIFVQPDRLVQAWELVLAAGEDLGITPCGLAARDSLRTGAVLPLSGQDIGPWPFINHPWPHALPYNRQRSAFTKDFIGGAALTTCTNPEYTYPMVGYDPRKVSIHDPALVFDREGTEIGVVLTCVADMAIGRGKDRIYGMTSPDRPEGFKPKGLMCGFVRVRSPLSAGTGIELQDNKRRLKAIVVEDIRPDRTLLRPMDDML
jgi:aminomethyltransferase